MAKLKSTIRRLLSRSAIGRPLVRLRFRMSRLSTRIMAIMLFPLVLFFVGLFSIDQYRTTLIRSEFTALERQGFTLARSLALAQSEIDGSLARRACPQNNEPPFAACRIWHRAAGAGVSP